MSNIEIRRFDESEWELYKSLRLASLRDSPDSFGSTLEREIGLTDEEWASRLAASSEPAKVLPLVSFIGDDAVGLAWAILREADSEQAQIYQMWVSPESRGMGAGKALLSRIISWANRLQLNSLALAVTTTNVEAVTLYNSFGFVPAGGAEPLRKGSRLVVQPMRLDL